MSGPLDQGSAGRQELLAAEMARQVDGLPTAELRLIARELSWAAPLPRPSADFVDRVMAALHEVPTPTPARAFVGAVAKGTLRDALAALASAWRLAWRPPPWVPLVVRAQALAFLLFFVLATTGAAAGGLVGAARILGPDAWFPPANESPGPTLEPTPALTPRLESLSPVESSEPAGTPAGTVEAGQAPEGSPVAGTTPRADESPDAAVAPGASPAEEDETSTPSAQTTATPRPTETPEESSTPKPSAAPESSDSTPESSDSPPGSDD